MPPGQPPALAARGVTKRFAGVTALEDVDFTLASGEVHALVGENGAGKSTLIKVLTGVHAPDTGHVEVAGQQVRFARPVDAQDAGVSTIYQEVNLVPLMSVSRNVFLGREPRTRTGLVDEKAMRRRSAELLEQYGVHADVRRPLLSFGVGTQQMVALARAVGVDAKVVVMDEPTSSLEPREVETLFGVIEQLKQRGIAIVYVSHRMDELYEVCESVTVLRDGRCVHTGRLADLPRLELVATMLGRSTGEVRRSGTTEFGEDHTADREPVLVASGLSRRHLVDDVSLAVRPGEVLGLGGLLGSGRSETLQAIAGSAGRDAGSVSVDGESVRAGSVPAAIRAGIVMLPEDRKAEGIIPDLSVRENIVLASLPRLGRFGFTSRARQDAIVETMMRRLHIKASSPDQLVSELSGGNQQKVMIARWLAMSPRVLLLDEPTRGVDVGAKAEVQSLIDELAAEGLAIVLVSSDLEEVLEGANRLIVLRDGAVVAELTGENVTEDDLMAAMVASGTA